MRRRLIWSAGAAALGVAAALWVRHDRGRTAAPAPVAVAGAEAAAAAAAPPRRRILRAPIARRAASGDAGVDADVIASMDPAAKTYDPVVVARTMNIDPPDLYAKEPREPAFADRREADLRDRILARLRKRLPFEVDVKAQCRTSSCEVTVQPAHGSGDNALNTALEALDLSGLAEQAWLAAAHDPDGGDPRLDLVLLFSADLRDHAEYERRLEQHAAHDDVQPAAR